MQKDGMPLIISGGARFQLYKYKSEEELEGIATNHSKEIFGADVIFFDFKKKLKSKEGTSGIPDGFLLDFKHGKFYIVEVELSTHDIVGHISNQLIRFKAAMTNTSARTQLAKDLYDKIVQNHLKQNVSLSDIERMINEKFCIAILIDAVSGRLSEIVDVLSQDGTEVLAIPFETYMDSKGTRIHKFTTFTKEALEKESKKWTFKWTTIPVEEHLGKTGKDMKAVFSALSKHICSLPNVKEKSRKGWITYQTSPLKNFCAIKFLPDYLEIHLKCDKSFMDEKGVAKNTRRTASWTFDKVFSVSSYDGVRYAMNLIGQAYSCICKK